MHLRTPAPDCNGHCCNGMCSATACSACAQNGGACQTQADCCSSNCSGGACAACPNTATCAQYLANQVKGTQLCGAAYQYATSLGTCLCQGACAASCGNNLCFGGGPDAACQSCSQDTVSGCGIQLQACAAH